MSTPLTSLRSDCRSCGKETGAVVPTAVGQPFLDALAFSNPETLSKALAPGETVLVQARANVGGLVGTNRRILIVKHAEAHEHSYAAIQDITIEKVGWFMDAVCQLVTAESPHQQLKTKAADRSSYAVSLVRPWTATFELAKARLLNIRDSRRCRHCGSFTAIEDDELRIDGRTALMKPIPSGGSDVLAAMLVPGENILLQVHGARYYKSIVVTDQRVILVIGRAPGRARAHSLRDVEGVEVFEDGLQLRLKGRPFQRQGGVALVASDNGIPGNEDDRAVFQEAAALIDRLRNSG